MRRVVAATIALLLVLLFVSMPLSSTAQPAQTEVLITAHQFYLKTITIHVGDSVLWSNIDIPDDHTATSDTGLWDSGTIVYGADFERTFGQAGTFPYHCAIHSDMTGTIIVQGIGTPTRTPTSTVTRTPGASATPANRNAYLSFVAKPVPPTATSTSPPTATNTPGPTLTPTPLPPGVYVLPNHSAYLDTIGFFRVVGEVINTTSTSVTFVHVPVDMLDSQGNVIKSSDGSIYLYTLLPGETTCFRAFLIDTPGRASYRFRATDYNLTNAPVPFLTLFNDTAGVEPPNDYRILGEVRNRSGVVVNSVIVSGTVYDPAKIVIDCDWGSSEDDPIGVNRTSRFDIGFSGRASYADAATYKIQADGDFP